MRALWAIALCACGSKDAPVPVDPPPKPVAAMAAGPVHCEALPFETETSVPEASGAAWVEGKLFVISDSGNDGAYGMLDPESGKTVETGTLALGDAGDDMEGVAVRGDKVFTLTSAGWMRVYKRAGAGFELVDGPYAIGDGRMICKPKKTNCARNYEGLCLAPAMGDAPSECTGFAASKEDGVLYCLKLGSDGHFVVVPERSIKIAKHDALADCAFDEAGNLWAASNFFDTNTVYRVDGWRDTASAKAVPIGSLGPGFGEGIAVRGSTVYRFSDLGGAPSLISKFGCSPGAR